MRKSKKILISLIIIVIILIIGVLAYKYFTNDEQEEVKVVKKIKEYGYYESENQTEIYKEEFNNLDKILSEDEIDYEEYAKTISKLFIIDFYTLDNKLSKNDIGGVQFIKDDMKDNFIDKARSTFYKYLEVKSNKRNQELPVVSKIGDISLENTTFVIKDVTTTTSSKSKVRTTTSKGREVDAYKVTISWEYEEDLGYEKEANMILIKENNKLYIVEMD